MPTPRTIAWGILGTGNIAKQLAAAIKSSSTGHLAAVASRNIESARSFAHDFGIPRAFGSYEDLLASSEVEAVYISLPNHLHAEWTTRAAQAGKHILCEKPFTLNHAEAVRVIDVVRKAKVFFMEAFMYRCHPQTARLVEILRRGEIGEVRLVQASFTYHASLDTKNIRFINSMGGGGIMDVGCYTLSMARLLVGAARGNPFVNPTEVRGVAQIGETTRVDHQAVASVKFPGGTIASLTCAMQVQTDCSVRVWGAEGSIFVPIPWWPAPKDARIVVQRKGETSFTEELIDSPASLYTLQVDAVARAIKNHDVEVQAPGMSWADTLGNMAALDAWRASVGLAFDGEPRV